jgi:hypothetical protein
MMVIIELQEYETMMPVMAKRGPKGPMTDAQLAEFKRILEDRIAALEAATQRMQSKEFDPHVNQVGRILTEGIHPIKVP